MWRPVKAGQTVTDVYQKSIRLASGRFAMLDDGLGFVPWWPVLDQRFEL